MTTKFQPQLDELDRKRYHLSIIKEIALEICGVRYPRQILDTFLMSAQGGVGAKGGFIFFSGDKYSVYRGVKEIEDKYLDALIKEASDHIIDKSERLPFFLNRAEELTLLLVSPIEDNRLVLLGLSDAMHGKGYDSDDLELLTTIAALFQISLNSSLFSTRVELLNSELQKQNIELDRQVFHLNALRELSIEAGQAFDVDSILSSFLPTLLGRFSRHQGLVLIYNRKSGKTHFKSMGIEPKPPIDNSIEADQLLFIALAGVDNKHIQPLQVEPILEMEPISSAIDGFVAESGFMFLVKEQMYGVLLLGKQLEDRKFSEQEQELLFASVAQSVLYIKNADSFATIIKLNQELEEQNEALRNTIEELTTAKRKITILETAARRIAKIVNRNAQRLMQVRPLDFALIIGISMVIGLIFNFQSPKGIPIMPIPRPELVKSISADGAKKIIESQNPLLIDARPREFYEIEHAKGAINVPPSLFDVIYPMNFNSQDPERPIIIYGRSFSRLYDEDVARKFFNYDHENIYLIEDLLDNIYTLSVKVDSDS
ncbi:MAG: hypothetical protein HQK68_06585 [Desulfamplus sp.]|nr:hypothetical protein [Desulfamplus sp.]